MTNEGFYFFDSYALIEILEQNPRYAQYTNMMMITSKLNLFEIFYYLLRIGKEKEALIVLQKYYKFTADFDDTIIAQAAYVRYQHKEKKLSMTDCIGYVLARQMNIKFLTGDKQFEHFENVEFVR